MCGIIAYTGPQKAINVLLEGLESLEYRGYDSAGVSVLEHGNRIFTYRSAGKLKTLRTLIQNAKSRSQLSGSTGIGHTRWATHGSPNDKNAHPHCDCSGEIVVVHNGIVENFSELRELLTSQGHKFTSETDSETIPHLIEQFSQRGDSLEEAVRKTAVKIKGSNAVVAMSQAEPGKIVALRLGNAGGIAIGHGKGEMFVASDLPALIPNTTTISYLEGGEIAILDENSATFMNLEGESISKDPNKIEYDPISITRGNYPHFMLKEINEQPEAIMSSLRGRLNLEEGIVALEQFPLSQKDIIALKKVVIVGMGTSLHAAMVARYWIEQISGIPAEWDNSSEFRYRNPIVDKNTLFVSISQSGETADTLAAMNEAHSKGARQITLCNYPGTQSSRLADGTLDIRAGVEIGVAATKTFLCSLTTLYMLAIHLGTNRGFLQKQHATLLIKELLLLPDMLGEVLKTNLALKSLAEKFQDKSNFLFLGRGINYPIAMEGALKLKEISYIHAEGYPAGEMKHGPISLIDENLPIVALIPADSLYEKMLSNISEVKARGGTVIAVASVNDEVIHDKTDFVIHVPEGSTYMNPLLLTLPLQLLSYYIAVARGCDVDQPRNLAKSVTVE